MEYCRSIASEFLTLSKVSVVNPLWNIKPQNPSRPMRAVIQWQNGIARLLVHLTMFMGAEKMIKLEY